METNVTRNKILAEALTKARSAARGQVIKSVDLDRPTRERLLTAGYLSEVMRGWYLLSKPAGVGTSTLWYQNFWDFIREYLKDRFGEDGYCLSSESSLDVHSGQNIISQQITVITQKPSNQTVSLPHDTSLLIYQDEKRFPKELTKVNGLNIMPMAEALCKAAPAYYLNSTLNIEICLKIVPPADVSRVLLDMSSTTTTNRIIGAYQKINEEKKADQIAQDLRAAGFAVTPIDPFGKSELLLQKTPRPTSPYAARIQAMWEKMREDVISTFPESDHAPDKSSIRIIEQLYRQDSYHSLSIEGYQVTPQLLEKIDKGEWSPDTEEEDGKQRDALAAKGYHEAFKSVLSSVKKVVIEKKTPGEVFYQDLQNWYRELFKPLVNAGLIKATDLAGYRNNQIYIAKSRHVPPPVSAVADTMETLEKLLKHEKNAAVRAILGHFIFVYIHPYMDGNGRIGRFILNLMLVSGGHNWTVIRTTERETYMNSLEQASVYGDIQPFTKFIISEMKYWKKQIDKLPK